MELRRLWLVPAAAFALAGCAQEDGPLSPAPGGAGDAPGFALECEVNVRDGLLSCSAPAGSGGAGSEAVIGNQGLHVQLSSANTSYDSGTGVFSTDVTVRNLLDQVIGTSDGFSADPDGVRIFFHSAPQVSGGIGTVSVRNADGQATFTSGDQDYFQYSQVITPGGKSMPRTWEWDVSSDVASFTFQVGVSAKVADESSIVPGLGILAQRITADTTHTCALDLEGNAYCWGRGNNGRLGNGSTTSSAVPVAVEGGIKFALISNGHNHTCGIAFDGTGYCWGSNGDGRSGIGTSGGSNSTPVEIVGEYKWTHLSTSNSNTCGVTVDGEGYCWGYGSGRLGDGIGAQTSTPSRVLDPPTGPVKWAMIQSAHQHSCGLTTEGVIYCWGSGGIGRRGAGVITEPSISAPDVPVLSDERFVHLTTKERHICAVTAGGDGYCWGWNNRGQIGTGNSGDSIPQPTKVNGGHKFSQIHTGWDYSCGLTFDGDIYCWGLSTNGRVGTGQTSGNVLEPTLVAGGHKYQHLATGHRHACGVTTGGSIYCWGSNDNGQLGNDSDVDSPEPVQVHYLNLNRVGFLASLPAASCGDGSESVSCFPARRTLAEHTLAFGAGVAAPRWVGDATSLPGPLAGA